MSPRKRRTRHLECLPLEAGRDLQSRPSRRHSAPAGAHSVAGLELPASQQNTEVVHGGKTAISRETFQHIADAFGKAPEGFTVHKKLKKLM